MRPAPLALGSWQALPVPGNVELGDQEIELHPAEGHTADGTAFFARWAGVLVCGDYLSDFEIPMIVDGRLARRLPRDARAARAAGRGGERRRARATGRLIRRDTALRDTRRGRRLPRRARARRREPQLPKGRDTPRQREIHADNL